MFAAQRKSAGLDLEAVEMATRAGLHRAGAAILTPLLAEPGDLPPHGPLAPAALRRGITISAPSACSPPWGRCSWNALTVSAPIANRARAPAIANWTWKARSVRPAYAA